MDLVYTYVNCNDEKWKENRIQNKELYYNPKINNIDSNILERFQDNNEIIYSIKNILKFLPWIRNIFIVTFDQIPDIIDEKIKIIDHKDIIPGIYLPTFNSHVIEIYLHKIPNLSDVFLYFNDDMIISKFMNKEDFIKDNKVAIFLDECNSKIGTAKVNEISYRSAWKNSNKWLDKNFKIERRKKHCHAPIVVNKKIMEEIFNMMIEEIELFSINKFRAINDYNIICSIYPYYALYKDDAFISNKKCICFYENESEKSLNDKINNIHLHDFLCINSYYKLLFDKLEEI